MNMLEYKGYYATVKYDADDDILVGEVFEINDTLCFHGSSLEELNEMFRQSIDNYLELCVKVGKQPEKEYRGCRNLSIWKGK